MLFNRAAAMNSNSETGTSSRPLTTNRGVTRREMVHRAMGGLGASLALSALTPVHPVLRHLGNVWAMAEADATALAGSWTPEFFDSHQNATFMAVAEGIVPGSTKVHVNRVVDLLLSVDT